MYKRNKKHGLATKVMVMILSLVLVAGLSIGGTLAWLTAETDPVTNTFTVGNIDITLQEHELKTDGTLGEKEVYANTYKFVPGVNLPKDPFVTVEAGSEACWLFVEITAVDWPETPDITYTVDSAWTALEDVSGVYYREVPAATADTDYYILANNEIVVDAALSKKTVEGIGNPKLSFVAYAVQREGIETAADAWNKL